MDRCQTESLTTGSPVYAVVEETLEPQDLARLTGRVFCERVGADMALISLNEWKPGVRADKENPNGIGGAMMPLDMTEMDIVCWLPTGWYGTIKTYRFTGKRIRELAETGYDMLGNGDPYPYVLVMPDGFTPEDDREYDVVFAGITDGVAAESVMTDSGVTGLSAMEAFLDGVDTLRPDSIDWTK